MTSNATFVRAVAIAWVMAVYVAGAQLAVATEASTLPALLWAPSGIGLGAVLAFGPALAFGVGAGAFCGIISLGGEPTIAFGIAIVDAAEVLAVYHVLRRLDFQCQLERVHDVIALVSTTIVCTSLSAAASTAWLFATQQVQGQFEMVWSKWWWGHLAGDLILTPLFITWLTARTRVIASPARVVEGLALAAAVVFVGLSVFEGWFPHWLPGASRPHYLYPLLIWAGLRFGPRGAATTNTAISVLAVTGIVYNNAPFANISEFQSFISISAVAALALGALRAEVQRAIQRKGAIQEAALDAIITIDAHDRIIEMNPAAERMFKIREPRARGRDVKMLFLPRSIRAQVGESLARYVRRQGDALIGQRVRTGARLADGSEIPIELAILQASIGNEDVFSASIRDISSELEAEAARRGKHAVLERLVRERTAELEHALERLHESQAQAHLGSYEYDLVTKKLVWSEELYRIYGRDRATFTPTLEAFLA
ncbi:MAG TPA: MASE1 domain-containing protein, partial [Kofleriaceae bacterium]|nr:MASE1 domain-containing protein [Kofleriaceae bacterium]